MWIYCGGEFLWSARTVDREIEGKVPPTPVLSVIYRIPRSSLPRGSISKCQKMRGPFPAFGILFLPMNSGPTPSERLARFMEQSSSLLWPFVSIVNRRLGEERKCLCKMNVQLHVFTMVVNDQECLPWAPSTHPCVFPG